MRVFLQRAVKTALLLGALLNAVWAAILGFIYVAVYFPVRDRFNDQGTFFDEHSGHAWSDSGLLTGPSAAVCLIAAVALALLSRRTRWSS